MRSIVEKIAPPAVVMSAALYMGWPPNAPLDLGDSPVRAAAVRWKSQDLGPPVIARAAINPFEQVLVAEDEMDVEPDTGKLVVATKPTGPSPDEMKSGLTLTGIANMGGRQWAVVNGKPRLPGDTLKANGPEQLICEIVSIEIDHVVVTCKETTIQLRPRPFNSRPRTPAITPVSNSAASPTKPSSTPNDIPPPPSDASLPPTVAPPQA